MFLVVTAADSLQRQHSTTVHTTNATTTTTTATATAATTTSAIVINTVTTISILLSYAYSSCYFYYCYSYHQILLLVLLCLMPTEIGGYTETGGRMSLALWPLPGSFAWFICLLLRASDWTTHFFISMIPTWTYSRYLLPISSRWTDRGSKICPDVRATVCVGCVAYVKGLGETYMTLNRRLVLLLYLLPLLNVWIKTKTGQAGNFEIVDIVNAKKIQRRKLFFVESARRIMRAY